MSSSIKTASIATATILSTALLIYQKDAIKAFYTKHRGYKGILQLIWVGDYLPPKLRKSMNELDKVEVRIVKSDQQLEQIEVLIEKARLESVDGSTKLTPRMKNGNSSKPQPQAQVSQEELTNRLFQQYPQLRTKIGIFSNKLDTLAACIDDIKSHSDDEVKSRKKTLSNRIVALMNSLDDMIATLNLEVQVVD